MDANRIEEEKFAKAQAYAKELRDLMGRVAFIHQWLNENGWQVFTGVNRGNNDKYTADVTVVRNQTI